MRLLLGVCLMFSMGMAIASEPARPALFAFSFDRPCHYCFRKIDALYLASQVAAHYSTKSVKTCDIDKYRVTHLCYDSSNHALAQVVAENRTELISSLKPELDKFCLSCGKTIVAIHHVDDPRVCGDEVFVHAGEKLADLSALLTPGQTYSDITLKK
jgi:hypothetical protein